MPQDKRYRSGSAAAGGGMLTLWLTMRANAWLRQEWLSLLTETAAEGIGLVLQFLMLGIPLVVTIELLRRSAAQPCPAMPTARRTKRRPMAGACRVGGITGG